MGASESQSLFRVSQQLETPEGQGCSSSLKVSRLKMQEEICFGFSPKAGEKKNNTDLSSKAVRQEKLSYLGKT